MSKTFIIEISDAGICDVWVYRDLIMRDIEKAIDLEEGLLEQQTAIGCNTAANMVKTA